jgi:addiction module RelE/StbE family toxin
MNVRWSPTAIADLQSIRNYISQDNPGAAQKIATRIRQAAGQLCQFPLSGRAGRVPGTRELVITGTSYIAAYIVAGDEVQIAAILHGKQQWPASFQHGS